MQHYLGYSQTQLTQLGALMTAQEIEQQPQAWLKVLGYLEEKREAILAFIRPILQQPNARIIFTGAGTSAFVGHALAPFIGKQLNRAVESIATTDIVSNPYQYLNADVPTLIVSFARSGNSPESVGAVALADQCLSQCYHLLITCNEQGALYADHYQKPQVLGLLMPPETHDRGFAMTSSFSSMMLAALSVFCLEQGSVLERFKFIAEQTQALIPHYVAYVQALNKEDIQRIIYLGSGGLQGLAQEAALKILELTAGKVVASYDSPLGFRHGPKSIVNEQTLIVAFLSNQPYTRLYDLDLLQELCRDNKAKRIVALSAKEEDASHLDKSILSISGFAQQEDYTLLFPYIVFAQIYAVYSSLKHQITTDNPCPTGEVNRVVQGVIIHPYPSR